MSIATLDIDAIVRQIMTDLGVTGASSPIASPNVLGSASASKASAAKTELSKQSGANDKSKLQLLDSLVTLASLEGRLDGVREIVITPKAVVTPSVRDLLYKKDIKIAQGQLPETVSRADTTQQNVSPNISATRSNDGDATVWLGLHDLKREPETLLQYLQGNGTFVKASFGCIIAMVEAAAKQLTESQIKHAIIVTNFPAAAAVLANRHATVRAVIGSSPEQTLQDAAQVAANMLVLSVDRLGSYRMREIARAFLTGQRQSPVDALIRAFAERGTR